jgi:hypothetical protein
MILVHPAPSPYAQVLFEIDVFDGPTVIIEGLYAFRIIVDDPYFPPAADFPYSVFEIPYLIQLEGVIEIEYP